VSATAIAAAVPRRRTTLMGRIILVQAFFRPWTRCDVELSDGTGTITLRFMGRGEIPGMSAGRPMRVEGTPADVRGRLIMLNPLCEFLPDTCCFLDKADSTNSTRSEAKRD
jgi:hypothetical protein